MLKQLNGVTVIAPWDIDEELNKLTTITDVVEHLSNTETKFSLMTIHSMNNDIRKKLLERIGYNEEDYNAMMVSVTKKPFTNRIKIRLIFSMEKSILANAIPTLNVLLLQEHLSKVGLDKPLPKKNNSLSL